MAVIERHAYIQVWACGNERDPDAAVSFDDGFFKPNPMPYHPGVFPSPDNPYKPDCIKGGCIDFKNRRRSLCQACNSELSLDTSLIGRVARRLCCGHFRVNYEEVRNSSDNMGGERLEMSEFRRYAGPLDAVPKFCDLRTPKGAATQLFS